MCVCMCMRVIIPLYIRYIKVYVKVYARLSARVHTISVHHHSLYVYSVSINNDVISIVMTRVTIIVYRCI